MNDYHREMWEGKRSLRHIKRAILSEIKIVFEDSASEGQLQEHNIFQCLTETLTTSKWREMARLKSSGPTFMRGKWTIELSETTAKGRKRLIHLLHNHACSNGCVAGKLNRLIYKENLHHLYPVPVAIYIQVMPPLNRLPSRPSQTFSTSLSFGIQAPPRETFPKDGRRGTWRS